MEPLVVILLVVVLALIGVLGFVVLSLKKQGDQGDDDETRVSATIGALERQIAELTKALDARLSDSRREMQDAVRSQFSESQRLIREVNTEMVKNLTELTREQTKTNEQTVRFAEIAQQLGSLEKTLKHQKQRGNWGEASLELILANILPPGAFTMQYRFKNNDAVDAVITTKDGLIPIDAKFSLDNYQRVTDATDDREREEREKEFKNDLKKRIDETAKYVRPEEGTLPFAFMFIPAEAIYYDLLVNEVGAIKVNTRNLIEYAYHEKKVIIVSPTTFSAYLQSVLYGFKAFKIEESAKDIMKRVDELAKHLKAYEDYIVKVGNALGTTVNHYNAATKELGKIEKDVTRITGASPEFEVPALDRPREGE